MVFHFSAVQRHWTISIYFVQEMTKNNEDEEGDLDNKKRKEIKDFAIWFNRTEKQNQEKRKKDLKRKRELEQVCSRISLESILS